MVIIAAVVVVAAAGGGAYYLLTKNNEPASDYTLLDSPDKLEKGVTIVIKLNNKYTDTYGKLVIDSVKDSKVTYSLDAKNDGKYAKVEAPSQFSPDNGDNLIGGLDYVNDTYEGITITHTGSDYKLSGKTDVLGGFISIDMTITYDSVVTAANGKVTLHSGSDTRYIENIRTVKTGDLGITVETDQVIKISKEVAQTEFFNEELFPKYVASEYAPAVPTQADDAKVGNVTANVYVVNGTDAESTVYDNLKMYVYDGIIIKADGKMDGESYTASLSIYKA